MQHGTKANLNQSAEETTLSRITILAIDRWTATNITQLCVVTVSALQSIHAPTHRDVQQSAGERA